VTRFARLEGHKDGLATKDTKISKEMRMEKTFAAIPAETEHIATAVIGAAIEVHRHLGPGFIEKIYQEALCLELDARGFKYERERAIVVHYRGVPIPGQRIDLIVAGCVLVCEVRIHPFTWIRMLRSSWLTTS